MQSRQAGILGAEGNPRLHEYDDGQFGLLWVTLGFGDCDQLRSWADTGNV